MTDLRAGATHLILPTLGTPDKRKGRFLDAVRKAAAGEFEILGELGRRADGGVAYLARDLSQPRLVALRFELSPGSHHDYVLDVLQELDSSLPATGLGCPGCGEPLRGWGRYCPGCGFDLSGSSGSTPPSARPDSLQSVSELVGEGYRILGQMRRAEGGGMIYFAREEGKDTIVGLRLRQGEGERPAVDRTAVIPFLADDSIQGEVDGPTVVVEESSVQLHSEVDEGSPTPPSESGPRKRQPSRVRSPVQFSWPLVVLVIGATLIVGLVLGALLT